MKELVTSGNALSRLMVGNLSRELPNATIGQPTHIMKMISHSMATATGYFESYDLFNAIHDLPYQFLNGTAPLNVTGCVAACVFQPHQPVLDGVSMPDQAECTVAQRTNRDSFMWYDELHPSEQANRIVARAISNLLEQNTSKWTTFYHGPQTIPVSSESLPRRWCARDPLKTLLASLAAVLCMYTTIF